MEGFVNAVTSNRDASIRREIFLATQSAAQPPANNSDPIYHFVGNGIYSRVSDQDDLAAKLLSRIGDQVLFTQGVDFTIRRRVSDLFYLVGTRSRAAWPKIVEKLIDKGLVSR